MGRKGQNMDEWLTVEEVAAMVRKSVKTVYKWIDEGRLQATKLGGRDWRIRRSWLDAMLAQYATE